MAEDPMRRTGQYMNAYEDRFTATSPTFRIHVVLGGSAWEMLTSGHTPPRFQLALHPINWAEHDRDRATIFETLHSNLARTVQAAAMNCCGGSPTSRAVLQHQPEDKALMPNISILCSMFFDRFGIWPHKIRGIACCHSTVPHWRSFSHDCANSSPRRRSKWRVPSIRPPWYAARSSPWVKAA